MNFIEKYEKLINYLKTLDSICIAYSSGVDSTFLLKAAKEALGEKVFAITVNSSMCPDKEINEAKKFTKELNIKHIIIDANEFSIPEFVENDKDRCYYCKKAIFTSIKNTAFENNIINVADGSNMDDDNDYRPGMRAIKELEIIEGIKHGSQAIQKEAKQKKQELIRINENQKIEEEERKEIAKDIAYSEIERVRKDVVNVYVSNKKEEIKNEQEKPPVVTPDVLPPVEPPVVTPPVEPPVVIPPVEPPVVTPPVEPPVVTPPVEPPVITTPPIIN